MRSGEALCTINMSTHGGTPYQRDSEGLAGGPGSMEGQGWEAEDLGGNEIQLEPQSKAAFKLKRMSNAAVWSGKTLFYVINWLNESLSNFSDGQHNTSLSPTDLSLWTRGRPIIIFRRRYRLLEDQKKPLPIKLADLK